MLGVVVRRLLQVLPVLFGVSLLVFWWARALPGDPATALLAQGARPGAQDLSGAGVAEVRRLYGIDRPLPEQYMTWLSRMARFDLGRSITTGQSVASELRRRFPATVELALSALLVGVGVGVPAGFVAARRADSWWDRLLAGTSILALSVPVFALAFLLKYVFAVRLGWLPTVGRLDVTRSLAHPTGFYTLDAVVAGDGAALADALRHLLLPAVTLGLPAAAYIARATRAAVLDVAQEDHVRTAVAEGLPDHTVGVRHILRNALLPVVTLVGLTAGFLLEGAALAEVVFAWEGIGSFLYGAIANRDYPAMQAGILYAAVLFVFVSLLVDIAYTRLDPRVRITS